MARDYILRMIEQIATMIAGLLARRRAGQVIQAREDLENHCVRTMGFTLSEIKNLAPEEVAKLMERGGALRILRALTVAELLLLDAQWHEEDRTAEQLLPNYVHAYCLIADSMATLSKEERAHYLPKLKVIGEKLGPVREHPYVKERWVHDAIDMEDSQPGADAR